MPGPRARRHRLAPDRPGATTEQYDRMANGTVRSARPGAACVPQYGHRHGTVPYRLGESGRAASPITVIVAGPRRMPLATAGAIVLYHLYYPIIV
eukprot:762488-Hanusia_phi.AAC.4